MPRHLNCWQSLIQDPNILICGRGLLNGDRAYIFGIRFPANFNSPYKAKNIIDFWRRWHITLSRFLRDYLYVPLGGNRGSLCFQFRNIWVTMLLGGIWHGAGWGFAVWGALHGFFLIVNHSWRHVTGPLRPRLEKSSAYAFFCRAVLFLAVVMAWVPFRAPTLRTAAILLRSMFGQQPAVPTQIEATAIQAIAAISIAAGVCWILPNTSEIFRFNLHAPGAPSSVRCNRYVELSWRPHWSWAFCLAVFAFLSFISLSKVSEFLYFQF
jgi:alginate O-acetyltransferase complex protein AlgI